MRCLLLVTCLLLEAVSRDVLQEGPQRVERVTQREWCTYNGTAMQLEINTYFSVDGKLTERVETRKLWPCDGPSSSDCC